MDFTSLGFAGMFRQAGLFGARILGTMLVISIGSFGGTGKYSSNYPLSKGSPDPLITQSIQMDNEYFADISFSPDGSKLAILSQPNHKSLKELTNGEGSYWAMDQPANIHVFDIKTKNEIAVIRTPFIIDIWYGMSGDTSDEPNSHIFCIRHYKCGSVAISGNGMVALAIPGGKVGLWNYITGDPIMIKGVDKEQPFTDRRVRVWFLDDDSIFAINDWSIYAIFDDNSLMIGIYRTIDGAELQINKQRGWFISKSFQENASMWNTIYRTIDWRQWNSIPAPGIKWPIAVSPDGELVLNFNPLSLIMGIWRVNTAGIGSQAILNLPIPNSINGKSLCTDIPDGIISQDNRIAVILMVYAKGDCSVGNPSYTKDQMGSLMVWDIAAKKQLFSTTFPMVINVVAAFRNDGMAIAYVSSFNTIDVLEVPTVTQ